MSGFPAIALAQINVTVGDIAGNVEKILAAYKKAAGHGAQIVLFPELTVTGYSPEDLMLMPAFRKEAMAAVQTLSRHTKDGAAMIVGSVWDNALVTSGADTAIYNAAILLDEGRIQHVQPKTHLPNYGVFDEKRLYDAGEPEAVDWRGRRIGIVVCEDVWSSGVPMRLKDDGAEYLLVMNASPFDAGKLEERIKVASDAAKKTGLPLAYVNILGGQDDIVFDGGSFALDSSGVLVAQLPEFEESIALISNAGMAKPMGREARIWGAMKLGLQDYLRKNGFKGVLLGLSGGIDSAATAALAVDALGKDNVRGVLLPSPYTSRESNEDALETAKLLGIHTDTIPVTPPMQTMEEILNPVFHASDWMEDVAVGGNLQARIRGQILMAVSNRTGFMLLSTGNKSELAVGYSTLYGDSCGGFNVLKDVYKTQIYALAKWRNAQGRVIPDRSITKAPSAELKPGQKDQDQLPPYDVLDAILALHIEGRLSAAEIAARGHDTALVEKILRMVRQSEYKRRQSCPGVRVSTMMFGRDRRYPLTNGQKP